MTVDDLRHKDWLGADPASAFAGLSTTFATTVALRDEARLDFVVAPVPSLDGSPAVRIGPNCSCAVFPWVSGEGT